MDQLIKLRGSYQGVFTNPTEKVGKYLKLDTIDSCTGFWSSYKKNNLNIYHLITIFSAD